MANILQTTFSNTYFKEYFIILFILSLWNLFSTSTWDIFIHVLALPHQCMSFHITGGPIICALPKIYPTSLVSGHVISSVGSTGAVLFYTITLNSVDVFFNQRAVIKNFLLFDSCGHRNQLWDAGNLTLGLLWDLIGHPELCHVTSEE